MLNYFPKFFTNKAIYLYLAVLLVTSVLYMTHVLNLMWMIFGIVEVLFFFIFANKNSKDWSEISEKKFIKNLFWFAFIVRIVWVVFSYFFYFARYNHPFEFEAADAIMYSEAGELGARMLRDGSFDISNFMPWMDVSDRGYPFHLSIVYYLTNDSIFIARLLKATISAFTCILIYKLASRTFNAQVGRLAAVFCAVMPNLIYYCGLHLKETEMTFLIVLYLERADYVIRSKNYNIINIALPVLAAGSLFFFRTVIGVTALFSFFTSLMFTSTKVLGMGKRTILIVWGLVALSYFVGGKIATEIEQVWEDRSSNQSQSMEYRANMKGGNQFVKYATGAVFAPMIFVIPFPTMVETPGQENQKLIHGGNYVKNIMAFFTMFALFLIIKDGKWREYTLTGSFMIGYLIVIALSKFAASERFHLPVLPLILMYAAYGISQVTNKTKKYFTFYMVFLFVALLGWSWFKLAGRGAI